MIPQRLLLFSAGGEEYACNLQQISEVMEPQQTYPVAGAPPHYLGLINFHGSLTALVDFPRYIGLVPRPLPGKLLVLDTKLAQLALRVDAVSSIVGADAVLEEAPDDAPFTEALLTIAARTVRLLRLEALIDGLEQGLRQPPLRPQP